MDCLAVDSDARSGLRSAMVRSVGERDFSAQETAHQLLSLPLVSCTFSFVTVSLDGGYKVSKDDRDEHSLELSILHYYATRSSLLDINLVEFVSNNYMYHGELRKHPSPVIVRTFPQHPSNPSGERYGRYCKYQLLKYKPWQGQPSNAWGDVEDSDMTGIQAYHSFLRTPVAESCIPHFANELDQAQHHLELKVKSLKTLRMRMNGCSCVA